MNTTAIFDKALRLEFITHEEARFLYQQAALPDMMYVANEIRKIKKAERAMNSSFFGRSALYFGWPLVYI